MCEWRSLTLTKCHCLINEKKNIKEDFW